MNSTFCILQLYFFLLWKFSKLEIVSLPTLVPKCFPNRRWLERTENLNFSYQLKLQMNNGDNFNDFRSSEFIIPFQFIAPNKASIIFQSTKLPHTSTTTRDSRQ